MESYRTEEEQVEALKRWWQENGASTVAAIVIAAALVFGWQGWQARKEARAEAASTVFQQLLEALAGAEQAGAGYDDVASIALRLKTDYEGTVYARFAALHLARLRVADGDLADAEDELRWVLAESSAGEDLHRVARLRLARVVAARGGIDEALGLLAAEDDDPYAGAYAMARGDVFMAAGREADARAAYREAQALADPARPLPGLEEKLDFLSPRPPAAGDAAGA